MALVPVFQILARAFFSFLGLTRTSGSRVAFFDTAFLGPAFLRLRSRAFLGLRLAVLRLALLDLLRPILRFVSFVLLRLALSIL